MESNNKTAMNLMVQWIKDNPKCTQQQAIEKATELRDTVEREQIEQAYDARNEDREYDFDPYKYKNQKHYYETTYNPSKQ